MSILLIVSKGYPTMSKKNNTTYIDSAYPRNAMFLKNIRKLNVILHISRSKEKNVSTVAEKWFGRI